MSVEQIVSWQTTNGVCYSDKQRAYHEEMVWLMNTQAENNRKGFDPGVFGTIVVAQRDLIAELEALKKTLGGKHDSGIREEVDLLLQYAVEWLEQADRLQAQMEGKEPDVSSGSKSKTTTGKKSS